MKDVQVNVIRWNGEVVVVNNRSLTALSKTEYAPTNVVDVTKDLGFSMADPDNVYAMVQRMREINFKPQTSIGVRPPGSHWSTPPNYFVELPKSN